jgi:hypothetical protein
MAEGGGFGDCGKSFNLFLIYAINKNYRYAERK